MPRRNGRDSKGPYYQWGSGRKYHYTAGNTASRNAAKRKADKQGEAIKANGYK